MCWSRPLASDLQKGGVAALTQGGMRPNGTAWLAHQRQGNCVVCLTLAFKFSSGLRVLFPRDQLCFGLSKPTREKIFICCFFSVNNEVIRGECYSNDSSQDRRRTAFLQHPAKLCSFLFFLSEEEVTFSTTTSIIPKTAWPLAMGTVVPKSH